ncbi:hypothetical protein V8E51_009609 [Hyaloscypha variabilis]
MATDGPFLNDFTQESTVEQQSENYQAAVKRPFLSESPNEVLSISRPSQEMIQAEENFPTSSQETAFSFTDFDFLQEVEARPNPSPASSGTNLQLSNSTPAFSEEAAFPSTTSALRKALRQAQICYQRLSNQASLSQTPSHFPAKKAAPPTSPPPYHPALPPPRLTAQLTPRNAIPASTAPQHAKEQVT